MKREQIIAQALRCIDEIYPEDNAANSPNFPLADFIDEAGRRVFARGPVAYDFIGRKSCGMSVEAQSRRERRN